MLKGTIVTNDNSTNKINNNDSNINNNNNKDVDMNTAASTEH